jgi:hypothetical protein
MGDPVTAGIVFSLITAGAGIANSIEQNRIQKNAASDQKKAYEQQMRTEKQAQDAQAQQFNKMNQRKPFSFFDGLKDGAGSGTMLTGPQGVDKDKMVLGSGTLLGL